MKAAGHRPAAPEECWDRLVEAAAALGHGRRALVGGMAQARRRGLSRPRVAGALRRPAVSRSPPRPMPIGSPTSPTGPRTWPACSTRWTWPHCGPSGPGARCGRARAAPRCPGREDPGGARRHAHRARRGRASTTSSDCSGRGACSRTCRSRTCLLVAPVRGTAGAQLIVLGQIRPTTWATLLRVDLVGQIVESSDWPVVTEALQAGTMSSGLAVIPVPVRVRLASVDPDGSRHRRGAGGSRHGPARVCAGAPRRRPRRRDRPGRPRSRTVGPAASNGSTATSTGGWPTWWRSGDFPFMGEDFTTEDAPRVGDGLRPGRARRAGELRVAQRHERVAPHGRERRGRGTSAVGAGNRRRRARLGPARRVPGHRGGRAPARRHRPHAVHPAARTGHRHRGHGAPARRHRPPSPRPSAVVQGRGHP